MRRPQPTELDRYRPALRRWMPRAEIRELRQRRLSFHGVITWRSAGETVRFLVEEKRHLRHQDAGVVVEQLSKRRSALLTRHPPDRILIAAPHIRSEQAVLFERAGIDYVDLAGNAHLEAPGLFVHIEGRKPAKEPAHKRGRPQRGWIKTVMAILVRPELIDAPYRTLAEQADVALGTVAACISDLATRGVLHGRGCGRRSIDRAALISVWVQAYVDGLRPKLKERRLQVQAAGKQELLARIRSVLGVRNLQWALTGAEAAAEHGIELPRPDGIELYAPVLAFEDIETRRALNAQPDIRAGNLLIIDSPGPTATPPLQIGDFPLAPRLLAYAELRYRGTNRAEEAARMLLSHILKEGTD